MTFCSQVRKLLQANETVLPDRIIESPLVTQATQNVMRENEVEGDEPKLIITAALCCTGLNSRTSVPPFLEYKKDWPKVAKDLWDSFYEKYQKPA